MHILSYAGGVVGIFIQTNRHSNIYTYILSYTASYKLPSVHYTPLKYKLALRIFIFFKWQYKASIAQANKIDTDNCFFVQVQ